MIVSSKQNKSTRSFEANLKDLPKLNDLVKRNGKTYKIVNFGVTSQHILYCEEQ